MMNEAEPRVGPARVRVGRWMAKAWEWFLEDLGMQALIALLPTVVIVLGGPLFVFLIGPVGSGLALVGLRKAEGHSIEFKDFTDGFARHFLPALLAGLLIFVFTVVGLIFLIVPGLVILAMYLFTFHFMVDQGKDFWEAMEASRRMVARDYFGFALFGTLLCLINFLGCLFMLVGLLATIPISALAVTAAYRDFSGHPLEPAASAPGKPVVIE